MNSRSQPSRMIAVVLLTNMFLSQQSMCRAADGGGKATADRETRKEGKMAKTAAKDANAETGTGAPARRPVVLEKAVKIAEAFGKRTQAEYHQTRQWVSARSICLQVAGAANADYETLMAVSSFGLGFYYHPKVFGPTYIPPMDWPNTHEHVARATGWRMREIPKAETPEQAWGIVKESIDAGRPVIGYFFMGEHVFVGYEAAPKPEDRKMMIVHPFAYQPKWMTWKEFADWSRGNGFAVVDKRTEPMPQRELAIETMQWLVTCAEGDHRTELGWVPPDAKAGLEGLLAFSADVGDVTKTPDDLDAGWLGCHCICPQASGRMSAAMYLEKAIKHLDGDAAWHLRQAANAYRWSQDDWLRFRKEFAGGEGLEGLKKQWTDPKRRANGRRWLRRAWGLERRAIASVRNALVALGKLPEAETTQLAPMKRSGIRMSEVACLVDCAKAIGVEATTAWVVGGSGFAFALNIHKVICPSGPTAWSTDECRKLARNVGVTCEEVFTGPALPDFAEKQTEAFDKIRKWIDSGKPCFAWDLEIPEWYSVVGYDEAGNILYLSDANTVRRVHHHALGPTELGFTNVQLPQRCESKDDRDIVREAFQFAVRHGSGGDADGPYGIGLAGYGKWIAALQDEKLCAERGHIGSAQAYNAMCWSDVRGCAVPFLQEARKRLKDAELTPLFDDAIKHYSAVSDRLASVSELFPFEGARPGAMEERIRDAGLRARAAALLREAQESEKGGLEVLNRIVKLMEKPR